MRGREKIEKDFSRINASMHGRQNKLLLEVLLDIRDLLCWISHKP